MEEDKDHRMTQVNKMMYYHKEAIIVKEEAEETEEAMVELMHSMVGVQIEVDILIIKESLMIEVIKEVEEQDLIITTIITMTIRIIKTIVITSIKSLYMMKVKIISNKKVGIIQVIKNKNKMIEINLRLTNESNTMILKVILIGVGPEETEVGHQAKEEEEIMGK